MPEVFCKEMPINRTYPAAHDIPVDFGRRIRLNRIDGAMRARRTVPGRHDGRAVRLKRHRIDTPMKHKRKGQQLQ
jgi:hypothetical protein